MLKVPPWKFVVGIVVLCLLGVSFILRDRVSKWLSFGPRTSTFSPNIDFSVNTEKQSLNPSTLKPSSLPPAGDNSRNLRTSAGLPLPSYTGRDPLEVRPTPEDVKLFTLEQRERLYSTIRAQARALIQNPTFFNGWIELGLLKKVIGDFEGARDAWEYAGLIEPLNSLSFSNLGELYWRYIHEYPKSEANFRISIKHKPDDIQNYVSLAELYHYSYKEKYELSDDVLLEGLGSNPNNPTLLRRLAHLYGERKEYVMALEWWQKVLEMNPNDDEVKNKINTLRGSR